MRSGLIVIGNDDELQINWIFAQRENWVKDFIRSNGISHRFITCIVHQFIYFWNYFFLKLSNGFQAFNKNVPCDDKKWINNTCWWWERRKLQANSETCYQVVSQLWTINYKRQWLPIVSMSWKLRFNHNAQSALRIKKSFWICSVKFGFLSALLLWITECSGT